MKKILSLVLVFSNVAISFAEEPGQGPRKGESFEQSKAQALSMIDSRTKALQEAKTCVSAAANYEALKKCHESMKEHRKEFKADRESFREDRKSKREEWKAKRSEWKEKRKERREQRGEDGPPPPPPEGDAE
jgi:hypothetical protein